MIHLAWELRWRTLFGTVSLVALSAAFGCTTDVESLPLVDGGVADAPVNRANGSECSSADDCSSGICSQGVCCNNPCDGVCMSCRVKTSNGTCVPLPDGQMWELVQNVRDVTRAMLVGTGITALYQGVTAFVGYSIFRVESPLVWASLTGIASILPGIGTALVWVPIAIFLMATHHLAAGIGLFAWGAVVVVFVADYILRPKLVGTRIRMNDLLVFIAIFGGVEAFGILGVVMGPIAVAVFLAIVRIYQRDYRPGGPPRAPDVTEPEETALQNAP